MTRTRRWLAIPAIVLACMASSARSQPVTGRAPAALEETPSPVVSDTTYVEIALGGGIIMATTDVRSTSADLSATRWWKARTSGVPRTILTLGGSYNETHKQNAPLAIVRVGSSHLRHFIPLTTSRFASGEGVVYTNNALGIRDQYLVFGTAGGLLTMSPLDLEAAAGPAWVHQRFATRRSEDFGAVALVATPDLDLGIVAKGVRLSGKVRYLLPFTRSNERWQVHAMGGLFVPVTPRVEVASSLFYEYVKNTPLPFKSSYLNSSVALKFKFGM